MIGFKVFGGETQRRTKQIGKEEIIGTGHQNLVEDDENVILFSDDAPDLGDEEPDPQLFVRFRIPSKFHHKKSIHPSSELIHTIWQGVLLPKRKFRCRRHH